MKYTIYKVTNKINGKTYIGSHKTEDLNDGYMGSGKYLKRAIVKNGIENFDREILFVFDNSKDMFAKEAELVNEEYLTNENTYNLKVGGFGGFDYINSEKFDNTIHSKKRGEKSGKVAALRWKNDSEYRAKAKEILDKYRLVGNPGNKSFTGRKHSEATKQKMREAKRK